MAISSKALNLKKEDPRPLIICQNVLHFDRRYTIPREYIIPCMVNGCDCGNLCGWVATCNKCGDVIHYCPWGCSWGIKMDKDVCQRYACRDPGTLSEISSYIQYHGYAYHFGCHRTYEFDPLSNPNFKNMKILDIEKYKKQYIKEIMSLDL